MPKAGPTFPIDEAAPPIAEIKSRPSKLNTPAPIINVIKYKNKAGEDKEISVGGALKQGEEHPAYKQAKQMTDTGDKPKGDKVDEGRLTIIFRYEGTKKVSI